METDGNLRWKPMETNENLWWKLVETYGNQWKPMETDGHLQWKPMETDGSSPNILRQTKMQKPPKILQRELVMVHRESLLCAERPVDTNLIENNTNPERRN